MLLLASLVIYFPAPSIDTNVFDRFSERRLFANDESALKKLFHNHDIISRTFFVILMQIRHRSKHFYYFIGIILKFKS